MKSVVIISHKADPDGWASAFVCNLYLKKVYNIIKIILWDYGQKIPDEVYGNSDIVMADISFPTQDMLNLYKSCKLSLRRFVWIDHHKTSIEDSIKHKYSNIEGLREIGLAACELAEKFFFNENKNEAIRLVGSYDTWRWVDDGEDNAKFFSNFIRSHKPFSDPLDPNWEKYWNRVFFEKNLKKFCNEGKIIDRYETSEYSRRFAYEGTFEGKPCLIMFGVQGSLAFNAQPKSKNYDIYAAIRTSPNYFSVSLYSKKEDVAVLAKKHGGGGHKNSAGFKTKDFKSMFTFPKNSTVTESFSNFVKNVS